MENSKQVLQDNGNLSIYERVRGVPAEAKKAIEAGRLKGKSDGTRRDAYGTRAIDVIRKYDTGSTSQKPQRAFNGTFPCFDIEKGEWRCFKVDRFVMIDKDYTL